MKHDEYNRPKFEATPVSGLSTRDTVLVCSFVRGEEVRQRGKLHVREEDRTVEREDKRGGKRSSLHPLAFTALYRRGYRFRGTNSEKPFSQLFFESLKFSIEINILLLTSIRLLRFARC